jgi:hypothetical protein
MQGQTQKLLRRLIRLFGFTGNKFFLLIVEVGRAQAWNAGPPTSMGL